MGSGDGDIEFLHLSEAVKAVARGGYRSETQMLGFPRLLSAPALTSGTSHCSQHKLFKSRYKAQPGNPSPPGVHRLHNFSNWVDYFGNWGLFDHCSTPKRISKYGDEDACTLSHTPHTPARSLPNIPFSHPQTSSI